MNKLSQDRANLKLANMYQMSEGLNSISKPLYAYIFSLLADPNTRRKGLIDSALLLNSEDMLTVLARMAYVKLHAQERHPSIPRKPFDPYEYIKGNLEAAKESFDPDNSAL